MVMPNVFLRLTWVIVIGALVWTATITPATAVSSSSYEKQIIDRTNKHRDKHDLVKVKAQSCVDRWAEGQARWMAKYGKLAHQSGRLKKILKDCKLGRVSENIAFGFASGNATVEAWMKSTGHRKNILTSKMRYIGSAAVKDDDGVWWSAQVFGAKK